ncbi:MAG TPA: disulfide bond formation protein DsbA, partial [Acidimicrobiia bacterium]|nr:disulfide bond formation protein DsbA [Acidimicrobiia bacterium]
MTLIEVFADIVCPFTHTGLARLITERTRRGAEIQLRVRAWPLEYVNGEPTPPELVTEEVAALRQSVAG